MLSPQKLLWHSWWVYMRRVGVTSSLAQLPWLYNNASRPATATLDLYRAQLPGFVDRYGPALADDECRIIQQLG